MRKRMETMCGNYELALTHGSATHAKYASSEEMARRYRDGMAVSLKAAAQVRDVLQRLGVNPLYFPRYMPFGVRLARICRKYEAATRENLARGLIREWEMRLGWTGVTPNPPDRTVLLGICERGFGVKLGRAKSDVRSEMLEVRSEDGQANRQGRQERQGQGSEKAEIRDQKPETRSGGEAKSEARGQMREVRSEERDVGSQASDEGRGHNG